MSYTNTWKEDHIDDLFDWVMDNKYDEAVSWSEGGCYHADDDFQEIIESYVEDNVEELWKEYIALLPEPK